MSNLSDSPVTADSVPSLAWDLRARLRGDSVVLDAGDDNEYILDGLPSSQFSQVFRTINGHRSVREVAEVSGVALQRTAAIVAILIGSRLAGDVKEGAAGSIAPAGFVNACRAIYPRWKARLFGHPLWVRLAAGQASPTEFMGWLLESYHFIEGANDRMPLAVSECHIRGVRDVLARHYVEEWDHGGFFMKSLNELGVSQDIVLQARPLPGTQAILNYMRYCARRGALYYAVCSGFLESTGTDRQAAREFYQRLTAYYAPDNPAVIKPMADHTDLDEDYGHGDMLELMSEYLDPIPVTEASRILETCAVFVELLEMWSSDVQRTYSQPGVTLRLGNGLYRSNALSW